MAVTITRHSRGMYASVGMAESFVVDDVCEAFPKELLKLIAGIFIEQMIS
jgi:hypothetical protein